MTPLREKREADLRLRNLAPRTIDEYLRCVKCFARPFGRSPAKLGAQQVRAYLLHLTDKGRAESTPCTAGLSGRSALARCVTGCTMSPASSDSAAR